MKESKAIYGVHDHEDFSAIVWETELGRIVTCEGKLNIKNDLFIRSIETGEDVDNMDLRNILMSILPR